MRRLWQVLIGSLLSSDKAKLAVPPCLNWNDCQAAVFEGVWSQSVPELEEHLIKATRVSQNIMILAIWLQMVIDRLIVFTLAYEFVRDGQIMLDATNIYYRQGLRRVGRGTAGPNWGRTWKAKFAWIDSGDLLNWEKYIAVFTSH